MRVFAIMVACAVSGASQAQTAPDDLRNLMSRNPDVLIHDVSVMPTNPTVTDEIHIRILISVPRAAAEMQEPEWAASIPAEFEIIDSVAEVSRPLVRTDSPAQSMFGEMVHFTVSIVPLAPGTYEIAPIEFVATLPDDPDWSSSASTEPITINIESILSEDDTTLADIKDPIDPPPDYVRIGAYVAGGVLAAALLAAGIAVIARRRSEIVPEPPTPAHVTAIGEIDALLAADLIERKRWKAYFGELSGILRRYIERRFDLHAPTQTTEEFLRDPRMSNMFEPQHDALVRGFLGQADMVKFAEGSMDAKGARGAAERVRAFVEETGVHSAHEINTDEEAPA